MIIYRIGSLGRLIVHRLSEPAPAPTTSTSPAGSSVMSFGDATDVFVSGIPRGYKLPDQVTARNFTGCMGSLYIDSTLVGLHNFQTNEMDSCSGCLEV